MHGLRVTKPLFQPLQLKEQHLRGAIMKKDQHSETVEMEAVQECESTVEIEQFG